MSVSALCHDVRRFADASALLMLICVTVSCRMLYDVTRLSEEADVGKDCSVCIRMSIHTDTGLKGTKILEEREIATSAGRVHLHIVHLAMFAESYNPTCDETDVAVLAGKRG